MNVETFCSTIIPTIGRSSLSRSVESILNQEFSSAEFEVIIVNDSGYPLPAASWHHSRLVTILHTNRRERSVARNTGAAIAKGRYLHFLDDDDWLAPGALQHLWSLSETNQAKWLYGITQLVDRNSNPVIRLQHNLEGNCLVQFMAGEWIPLQSSIIDARSFFELGGFNPLLSGPEDIDLLRRFGVIGEVAQTPNLIAYVVRGEEGSTTDYQKHPKSSRWAREKVLNAPNVFTILCSSAKTPAWRGRIARIYLTSMLWNAQQCRLFSALSRLGFGLAGIANAGSGIFSTDFWNSLSKPYASETFRRGRVVANPSDCSG